MFVRHWRRWRFRPAPQRSPRGPAPKILQTSPEKVSVHIDLIGLDNKDLADNLTYLGTFQCRSESVQRYFRRRWNSVGPINQGDAKYALLNFLLDTMWLPIEEQSWREPYCFGARVHDPVSSFHKHREEPRPDFQKRWKRAETPKWKQFARQTYWKPLWSRTTSFLWWRTSAFI